MGEDQTFPSECVPLVGLEEGPCRRSRSDAVHLPALDPLALSSGRQTRPWRTRGSRRQNNGGGDSTFLQIDRVSDDPGMTGAVNRSRLSEGGRAGAGVFVKLISRNPRQAVKRNIVHSACLVLTD